MAATASVKSRQPRTNAQRSRQAVEIDRRLAVAHPDAKCALDHANPLQLLVATVLSAQCTDVRVNLVTPELFRRFPMAADLAGAEPAELEGLVKPTGFFRNKAKNLRAAAAALVSEFGGEVPRTMEELLTLPGVARKTANVVLGNAFGVAAGVVVDTHVQRLARLTGLTSHEDPAKIERDLMDELPQSQWIDFSHRLIFHGRRVCIANRPRCGDCPLEDLCPSSRKG